MAKIFLASDHAGFALKGMLVTYLNAVGYETQDLGPLTLDPEDDYPDFVTPCAQLVASNPGTFGIVIGASGQAEGMCANRVKGVRCAVYYGAPSLVQTDMDGNTLDMIASMRAHNDANMLSLGARFLAVGEVRSAVKEWLETPFSNAPRHVRRLNKF